MLSWSISTEFGFYLLFPLLAMNFERTWHWKLLGSALLAAGIIAACEWLALPGYTDQTLTISNHGLVYIFPLARLFEFILGMSVSLAFLRMRDLDGSKLSWTAVEVGSVALAVANACSIGLLWSKHSALNEYFLHSGSALSLALVVLVFALQKGYVSQLLTIRPLVYLGEISYSIYLLHAILYGVVSQRLAGDAIDDHLAFWPLLLVSSMLMYEGVEGPLRTRLRRLLASRPSIAPEPAISQPERRAA
jgi:peptidoglycan/LPS O-acetylase OafA/YrhL